jgi:BirA family biotin operon repressor/biotin-[acetyl-CoA-carboxylase] ligase
MDERTLRASLRDLPLGELRYFPSVSSTNDEALAWAAQGGMDMSIVIADEQTSGRGRQGRKWFTPPDSALAFSLLMRPTTEEVPFISRIVGLAALALAEAIRSYSIPVEIKWPNDILISGRKAAGILVESVWNGETIDCSVIGVGLNIVQASVPPQEMLTFPAASLEDILGEASVPPREMILRDILQAFIALRPQLTKDELITRWEAALAFRGQEVEVIESEGETLQGTIAGLDPEGRLLVKDDHGKRVTIHFGDVRLRPAGA